jgi:hypothetical protein
MGITATTEHLKAAFILSKNQMDVTAENLHAVKEIEAKITAIANKLHPLIAATMIKEGLNPLELHADQLLSYIKQFNYDMGESGAEKIARYIRETDKSEKIDSDTRKTMIGIYRMLYVIQKDGAAALGLAMQMKTPLTLGGLFDLAQNRDNRKRGKIDVTVNDAFGELERIVRPEASIRQIITSGTAKHAFTHMDVIADSFTDNAHPTALEKLIKASRGMEQALEDFANDRKPPSPAPTSFAAATEQIQTFINANPETIYKLQNRNISTRPGHIKAFEDLSKSERALENALSNLNNDELSDAIPASDLSVLQAGQTPGEVLAQIRAALGEEEALDPIKALLAVTHGFNGDAEKRFQIPIRINGRISHLNMYVLNDRAFTADDAKIFMSLDTARLGTVTIYFTVNKENGLEAVVSAETPAALAALEARQDDLSNFAEKAGIKINGMKFMLGVHNHG